MMTRRFFVLFLLTAGLAVGAETEPSLSLAVELVDGSRLTGTPSMIHFNLESSYTAVKIPMKRVAGLSLADDRVTATLNLANGDRLTGKLDLKGLKLTGAYGTVGVPQDKVVRILVGSKGGGPKPTRFRLELITGICSIRRPNSGEFGSAVEGMSCPLGTRVRTGGNATVDMVLSPGNTCKLSGKTEVVVKTSDDDKRLADVVLDKGHVTIALARDAALGVISQSAVYSGKGVAFSVEARVEHDLAVEVLTTEAGTAEATGAHYSVTVGPGGGSLGISGSRDGKFSRLKALQGAVVVHIVDNNGNPKDVQLQQGGIIKIWSRQAQAGNVVILTYLVTGPDGTLVETITTQKQ